MFFFPIPSRFVGHEREIAVLLSHPHLPLLVSGSGAPDTSIRVWDLESRALLLSLNGHRHTIYGLALDPAGRRLASASGDDTVRLWDLDSSACLHTLEGHAAAVLAVAWNPSGSRIASCSWDKTIHVWDADSGVLRRTWSDHGSQVYTLVAHPSDDLFASGSGDRTIRVWCWSKRDCVRVLRGHTDDVDSLASSTAFLVSSSADKTVRVWSWASDACVHVLRGFEDPLGSLNAVCVRDSVLALVNGEGVVRLWDTRSSDPARWECLGSLRSKASIGNGLALLDGGRVACAAPGDNTSIAVWGCGCA